MMQRLQKAAKQAEERQRAEGTASSNDVPTVKKPVAVSPGSASTGDVPIVKVKKSPSKDSSLRSVGEKEKKKKKKKDKKGKDGEAGGEKEKEKKKKKKKKGDKEKTEKKKKKKKKGDKEKEKQEGGGTKVTKPNDETNGVEGGEKGAAAVDSPQAKGKEPESENDKGKSKTPRNEPTTATTTPAANPTTPKTANENATNEKANDKAANDQAAGTVSTVTTDTKGKDKDAANAKNVDAESAAAAQSAERALQVFEAARKGDKSKLMELVQGGLTPEEINKEHRLGAEGGTVIMGTSLHAACRESRWDAVDVLLYGGADVNARDSEYSSVLLTAVSAGAPAAVVGRLIEKNGANVFLANTRRETAFSLATDPDVLALLIAQLKQQPGKLPTLMGSTDKVDLVDGTSTFYAISFAPVRKHLKDILPPEVWGRAVHLIRFDPGDMSAAHPKEVLLPVILGLHNFATDASYAAIIANQPGAFAFLFGLTCKHPHEAVQRFSAHCLLSLSQLPRNKEVMTTKWFLVLVKILSSTNTILQSKALGILAEITIGNAEAKEKVSREVGIGRLVSLLCSQVPEVRAEACRVLVNITNGRRTAQREAVKEGALSQIVQLGKLPRPESGGTANVDRAGQVQLLEQLSAAMALGNLAQLLADREEDPEPFSREDTAECAVGLLRVTDEDVQEHALRALSLLATHRTLAAEIVDAKGLAAVLPFAASANPNMRRYALKVLALSAKKCAKRAGAQDGLEAVLQSAASREDDVEIRDRAAAALRRLSAHA